MSAGPDTRWADDVGAYLLGRARAGRGARASRSTSPAARACRRDVADLQVAADALPVSVAAASAARGAQGPDHGRRRVRGRAARGRRPRRRRAPRAARRSARRAGLGWLLAPGGRARLRRWRCSPAAGSPACCSAAATTGAHGRGPTTQAPGADVRLEIRDDGSHAGRREHAAAAARPRLPGVAQAAGPGPRADRRAVVDARATARPRSRCPARSTASRRCSSPTSRSGGSEVPSTQPVITADPA